mgnify:CR=1 FL=1
MAEKYHLDKLEFYITNVCNLTCSNCNRYNNFHFRGWAAWDNYADNLRQWAEKIHVQKPVILGGEPLLNPDLEHWIHGIAGLWPDANIFIITNGTQLKNRPDLFGILKHYRGRVRIDIHRHNPGHWETLQQDVEKIGRAHV